MIYLTLLPLTLLIGYAFFLNRRHGRCLRLNVEIPLREKCGTAPSALTRLVMNVFSPARLHRLNVDEKSVHASFFVECRSDTQILALIDHLRRSFPSAGVSLVDPAL